MDATFKLNKRGFPVFVCGISDFRRRFHPVCMFISSQQTTEMYTSALRLLKEMFYRLTNEHFMVRYFMGDAENAQYNAFHNVFWLEIDCTYLMCFFHVVKNICDRVNSASSSTRRVVMKHLYKMHYSQSLSEFEEMKRDALTVFKTLQDIPDFASYILNQWLENRYINWQCFRSRSGHAKTNNPAEAFNKIIKRDYKLEKITPMRDSLEIFLQMCANLSMTTQPFVQECQPSDKLIAKTKKFTKEQRIKLHKSFVDMLLNYCG